MATTSTSGTLYISTTNDITPFKSFYSMQAHLQAASFVLFKHFTYHRIACPSQNAPNAHVAEKVMWIPHINVAYSAICRLP